MNQHHSTTVIRYTVVTAMLAAVSTVLQFLEFPVPFLIPSFVEMDFSDLPALIASFSMGPVSGVLVCLIKNLLHALLATTTGGVGELANFLLSASFVLVAGLIYHLKKCRLAALLGSLCGALFMALISIPVNFYLTYPIYYRFLPEETVLSLYQALIPSVKSILQCLVVFNAPFNLLKGAVVTGIAFIIYKPLSPYIKGKGK